MAQALSDCGSCSKFTNFVADLQNVSIWNSQLHHLNQEKLCVRFFPRLPLNLHLSSKIGNDAFPL